MMRRRIEWLACGVLALFAAPGNAESRYVGLAARGTRIETLEVEGGSGPTVLLLGGMNGADESSKIVKEEVRRFQDSRETGRRFRLLAVPVANPEANKLTFPPAGAAYRDHPESHALWR